jgi:hypothetical protein
MRKFVQLLAYLIPKKKKKKKKKPKLYLSTKVFNARVKPIYFSNIYKSVWLMDLDSHFFFGINTRFFFFFFALYLQSQEYILENLLNYLITSVLHNKNT